MNLTELNKLEEYLKAHGYDYDREDHYEKDASLNYSRIDVYDTVLQKNIWSVLHCAKLGLDLGLLEAYGDVFGEMELCCLTANDIIKIIEEEHHG